MKKLFLYPVLLCLTLCFSGCNDADYCNECDGLCCYKEFSSPTKLNEDIELDMDSDGEGDVLIRNCSEVEIKAMSSNVEVSTGMRPASLPTPPYYVIRGNQMLNYFWDWKSSITLNQNISVGDYIGVRFKGIDCYYYGWIKLGSVPAYYSGLSVSSVYLYKGVNDPVYAGVRNPDCN
ncbi:MAG TPA: hypothetical protein DD434_04570 [Bacteroidales bacterium]|nr:hypothetical protein [Bacteroidales bacterium]